MSQTLVNHRTVSIPGVTYHVHTETGAYLGSYSQRHGDHTVTSDQLPGDLQNVAGPLEAIAAIAQAAGIVGYRLSEDSPVSFTPELVEHFRGRIAAAGGLGGVGVHSFMSWADDMGLPTGDMGGLLEHLHAAETEAVAA